MLETKEEIIEQEVFNRMCALNRLVTAEEARDIRATVKEEFLIRKIKDSIREELERYVATEAKGLD